MGTINTKRPSADVKARESAHLNWMGGVSFDVSDPVHRLRIAASSCFFGEPMYYHAEKSESWPRASPPIWRRNGAIHPREMDRLRETLGAIDPREWRSLSPSDLMVKAIDEALDSDPESTLKQAVRLRNEENIRTTPQVILVRAAHHPKVKGTGLVSKYALEIIRRADEPAVGLAYQVSAYGKDSPIPNSLKKAWSSALERFNEYQLAKYRMQDRVVKTVDVVNLCHPKSEAVGKLVKGQLKNSETWESILSKEGSSPESWTKALDVMGHMAMLRNVRNLIEKKVDPGLFLKKLVDGAPTGKQLPFRYVSAYNAIKDRAPGSVQDAIEECLKVSLGNLPSFPGRVMSLCDNSGSAQSATTSSMGTMRVSTIANLTGVLTGMRADDGHMGVFGNRLETFAVRKNASVFDQLGRAEALAQNIGGDTENGIWLFFDNAIKTKEHWDHIFVYSDTQAGHGGLYGTNPAAYRDYLWRDRYIDVAQLVRAYRTKVNPRVNVFLVQVAGYQDTIVPEFYDRTYILGGWGDGILRFAAAMAGIGQRPQNSAQVE
jgi:hypothetical protein